MGSLSTDQQGSEVRERKGSRVAKHKWTRKEDLALVEALLEIRNEGWIKENGVFKSGYLTVLEKQLKSSLPGSDLKASPHIESRLKMFKRQYDAISEIISGATGIKWDSEQNIVICKDDEVWEEWCQDHPFSKGLRNVQTPYYDDLVLAYGSRVKRTRVESNVRRDRVQVREEERMNAIVPEENERLDDYDLENRCTHETTDLVDRRGTVETDSGADDSNNQEMNRQRVCKSSNELSDDEQLCKEGENQIGVGRSTDANVLLGAIDRIKRQRDGSATAKIARRKRCCCGGNSSTELREVMKVIGTCLQNSEKQSNLLVDILGRQVALDKAAAERRERLNGELTKLPSLNLQSRLRAASLIVSDSAKLDLFYSLPNNERGEWVSMVLSGLI